MQSITFTCETITPMFLAGADGTTPELRAPSIKGALRFWWRAMNGHLSLEDLKAKEDEIFGGTDNRSKVTLRVKFDEEKAKKNGSSQFFGKYALRHSSPQAKASGYL
jgi:CRISPR-associated protein Cmr1